MRVLKTVKIRFMHVEATCTALFDTGSSYTILQRAFFEKAFGASWKILPKPVKLYLVNGELVEADKYAEVTITIDDVELLPPETILILDEFIEEEVEVDGKKIRMPEAIIGSGTMDKYGILLDPRGGVIVGGAGLLL
jgi:predicted aspartyl protease